MLRYIPTYGDGGSAGIKPSADELIKPPFELPKGFDWWTDISHKFKPPGDEIIEGWNG